jgi:hypothetical protein
MVTMVERITKVETKMDSVHSDVKEIKTMLSNLDSKFSAKWVERAVIGIIIMVIGSVLVYAITL